MSRALRTTPSDLYSIHDEVAAWCFNRAVHLFGSSLQAELDEARQSGKNKQQSINKQQAVLSRWLNVERKFRDPAASGATGAPVGAGEIVQL